MLIPSGTHPVKTDTRSQPSTLVCGGGVRAHCGSRRYHGFLRYTLMKSLGKTVLQILGSGSVAYSMNSAPRRS